MAHNVIIMIIFLIIVVLVVILRVGEYSESVSFKLLVINLLYGFYRDMFTINDFIQLSILPV